MTAGAVDAYIGLGSNLESPFEQIAAAFGELADLVDTRLIARSPVYLSAPLGPPDQPDFLNAVARLRTRLTPTDLLQGLHTIEAAHARERRERWGPRTLDLDLLLYGDAIIDTPVLRVPHSQMHLRAFVLVPLRDINPDLHVPGMGPLHELAGRVDAGGLSRVESAHDG
jgi:2-amino-4-hydroxy-6-hydroxymethyldihydropteridine diphosphokinase